MESRERLKEVREIIRLTQAQFADKLEYKPNKVRDLESGKQRLTFEIAMHIEEIFFVRREWLLNGEGAIFDRPFLDHLGAIEGYVPLLDDPIEEAKVMARRLSEEFVLVPRYNVEGSAGGGSLVEDEEVLEYLSFRKEWIRSSLRVSENNLAVISVKGDSMEPRLRDGDVVLLDMSSQKVEDNAIYALQFNGGLSIKRVQRFISGAIKIISDNVTHYSSEDLTPDQAAEVKVVGRVVWAGGKI